MVIIKEEDRRLLEFGKQAKSYFENKGYKCSETRPWNSEYELSLCKTGNFNTIHREILDLLRAIGFTPYKDDAGRHIYVNVKEMTGCEIDKDRHYISLFSNFKAS